MVEIEFDHDAIDPIRDDDVTGWLLDGDTMYQYILTGRICLRHLYIVLVCIICTILCSIVHEETKESETCIKDQDCFFTETKHENQHGSTSVW
jgi:hypothetical protein